MTKPESTPYIGISENGDVILDEYGVPMVKKMNEWQEYSEVNSASIALAALPDRMPMRYDPNTGQYVKV